MSKLIVASNNQGKIKEIKEILRPYFDEIISIKEAGVDIDVEETGSTFYENALIKAKAVYDIVKTPVLSDDSGICADALDGGPGVFSARYAGPQRSDADNNLKLLNELEKLGAVTGKERAAYFACSAVLYVSEDRIIAGEGKTFGYILNEVTGSNGFGYDSVFFSDDLSAPFGLANAADKNKVSHRFRALQQIVQRLKADL